MEDTGHYNFAIESSLLAEGYKVALINPITTKSLRKASLKSVKSDKEDALLITKALLDKAYYRIISIQDEKLKEAKELTRYRTQLTLEMNRKRMFFNDILTLFFLNLIHYLITNTPLLI
ncbi:MAG: IS110 family transposase [Coprobacillus cateniformis]